MKIILGELAQLLKDTSYHFFNFDGSKNNHPLNVPEYHYYPTLMLWPVHNKTDIPKLFEGKRTIQSIFQFLEENLQTEFIIPQEEMQKAEEKVSESTKLKKKENFFLERHSKNNLNIEKIVPQKLY
jgi:hypothetical protein